MIANADPKGSDFMGAVRYDLQKSGARYLGGTLPKDLDEIRMMVAPLRQAMPALKNAVWHPSLSLPPGESLTDEQWLAVAEKYLAKMGFANCPYVVTRHTDTDQEHVHLAVLRIDHRTLKAMSLHNDYARSARIVQDIEREYGLRPGALTPAEAAQRSQRPTTRKEWALEDKHGITPVRELLRPALDQVLEERPAGWDAFVQALDERGIRPMLHAAKSGQVVGLSYEMDGRQAKSSRLGGAYTLSGLAQAGVRFDAEAHKDVVDRAVAHTSAEVQGRMERREARTAVRAALEEVLSAQPAPSLPMLMEGMRAHGVEVVPHIQGTGRLSGLRYEVAGQSWKSSQLGKEFGWKSLAGRGATYDPDVALPAPGSTAAAPPPETRVETKDLPTATEKELPSSWKDWDLPDRAVADWDPDAEVPSTPSAPPSNSFDWELPERAVADWDPDATLGRTDRRDVHDEPPSWLDEAPPPMADWEVESEVARQTDSEASSNWLDATRPEAEPAETEDWELPEVVVEPPEEWLAPPVPPRPSLALRVLYRRYADALAGESTTVASVLAVHGHDVQAIAGVIHHVEGTSLDDAWDDATRGAQHVDETAVDWLLAHNRRLYRGYSGSDRLGHAAGRLMRDGVEWFALSGALERAGWQGQSDDLSPRWQEIWERELDRVNQHPHRLDEGELAVRLGTRLQMLGASRFAAQNALLAHTVSTGASEMEAARRVFGASVGWTDERIPPAVQETSEAYLTFQSENSRLRLGLLEERATESLLQAGHAPSAVTRALLDHSPFGTVEDPEALRWAQAQVEQGAYRLRMREYDDIVRRSLTAPPPAVRREVRNEGAEPSVSESAAMWAQGSVVHAPSDRRLVGARLDLERQLDALGVMHHAVVLTRPGEAPRYLGVGDQGGLEEMGFERSRLSRRQLLRHMRELSDLNRDGWDVSLRPIDSRNHHVVVRTDREGLEALRKDGHTPSLVLAAGAQLQVVLRVPRQGNDRQALLEHYQPYAREVSSSRHQVAHLEVLEARRAIDRGVGRDRGEDRDDGWGR